MSIILIMPIVSDRLANIKELILSVELTAFDWFSRLTVAAGVAAYSYDCFTILILKIRIIKQTGTAGQTGCVVTDLVLKVRRPRSIVVILNSSTLEIKQSGWGPSVGVTYSFTVTVHRLLLQRENMINLVAVVHGRGWHNIKRLITVVAEW